MTTGIAARSVVQVLLNLAEGGMETMAVNLSLALRARGHRVTVIALDEGGRHEQALHENAVEWHVLGGRRLSEVRRHRALTRILRDVGADIVHTHHFSPLLHTVAAATFAGWVPIVHTEHSYQYLQARPDYRLALWALSLRCRSVVLVGQAMRSYYRKQVHIGKRRLKVIPNGVALRSPGPAGDRKAIRSALGLREGVVIVSAGRFFPVKRYEDLLAAVAIARRTVAGLHLVLLGSGPEQRQLEALGHSLGITDVLHFPGWQQDVATWLAGADIFALTSQSEGLPMAVLEAMAMGIPVIATAVGDLPEVLGNGQGGILVPVRSPQHVADAIVTLAGNPEMREGLGRSGRARVEQFYSLDAMVDSYASLYG